MLQFSCVEANDRSCSKRTLFGRPALAGDVVCSTFQGDPDFGQGTELGEHDNVQHSENDTPGPCHPESFKFFSKRYVIDDIEFFGWANRHYNPRKFRARPEMPTLLHQCPLGQGQVIGLSGKR